MEGYLKPTDFPHVVRKMINLNPMSLPNVSPENMEVCRVTINTLIDAINKLEDKNRELEETLNKILNRSSN